MKKLTALILVCLLCVATAYAGEWPEGLSSAKPMPGVPEVKLDETIGYYFPTPKPGGLEARLFCDVLEFWMPREDIVLGDGHAHLCDANGEVADIDFANPDQVKLRVLEQEELEYYFPAHPWGCGVCIEMYLPVSLKLNEDYYVLMDANCFSAAEGKVTNPVMDEKTEKKWMPILVGDYGISGLYYCAPSEKPVEEEVVQDLSEEEEKPEPTKEPEETGPIEPKLVHEVGDDIHFDLVLGGDAKVAVVYSENDSVYFETPEYTESCTVTGTITKEDLDWGVVFLNENGEQLDYVSHLR